MTRAGVSVIVLLSGAVFGQTATPAFDAADVHPSPRNEMQPVLAQFMRNPPFRSGRYEMHNANMVDLVRTAYGVDPDKVLDGPSWVEWDRFEVIAKAPPTTSAVNLKLMLRALLADRFKLAVREETRELPTYAITVAKKSLLKPASGDGEPGCKGSIQGLPTGPQDGALLISSLTFSYSCRQETMAAFADLLHMLNLSQSYLGGNPIQDHTELTGAWDFDFHYNGPRQPNSPPETTTTTLFDALEKQAGLKLEKVTVPIPVIVIASANEQPTPNAAGIDDQIPKLPQEFEVADIRPSQPGAKPAPVRAENGRLNLPNYLVKNLLALAFNAPVDSMVGLEKWMDSARFDLIAQLPRTAGPPQPLDPDTLRPAIVALLKDRFKLAYHTEQRPSAYVLKAVKPKLEKTSDPKARTACKEGPAADGKDPRKNNPALSRLVTCRNMTMAQFAQQLAITGSGYIRGEARDATGLEGAWDFTLNFSPPALVNGQAVLRDGAIVPANSAANGGASDPTGAVSLFDALNKQLGLKLEEEKRPMPVIVIDHMEQTPTDN